MNVGDTIKCNNPDEAVDVMNELARGGALVSIKRHHRTKDDI